MNNQKVIFEKELLAMSEKMIGASEKEIEEVINLSPLKKLPQDYLDFLSKMGKFVSFLNGHSCFIRELPLLRQWASELLSENNFSQELSNKDFVFWMSQGYQFAFFRQSKNELDIYEIYYYIEGQKEFIKIADNLYDFLYRMLTKDKYLFPTVSMNIP